MSFPDHIHSFMFLHRELEVRAKLLKGNSHRAIVLEEDITISNLTEPYFDRLEYDCYIKGSYTENGEEKHHTITLEHATAPLIKWRSWSI